LDAARKESDALRLQLSEVQQAGPSTLGSAVDEEKGIMERDLRERDKALAAAK
jgi:hypothetical protein